MADIFGTGLNDVLVGTTGADRIEGGAGNDRINGGAGDDLILGGTGADILTGDAGNDRIYGEEGNDGIYGGGGNDTIDGGVGDDTLIGDGGNDDIFGGLGNDKLYGGIGNDRLDGGAGNDLAYGEAGDDVFVYRSGDGNDTFVGGSGNDRIELQLSSADVTDALRADLAAYQTWSASQVTAAGSAAALAGQTAGDTFTFYSLGLSISVVEGLAILIDGQEASLASLLNRAPMDVALSNTSISENASAGTVVGVLSGVDPDAGQSANLSFSLVTPSDAFEIVNGNQLVVKAGAALDFEGQKSFAIDVRATDTGGLSKTQTFTVSLSDVNEAPTTVALSSATVVENASAGTVVGVLSGVDPDAGQSANLSFSLVTPSDAFEIVNGNQLVVKAGAALDFEGQKSFAIDVRATDTGGLSKTQTFTVSLSDVNEAPSTVALSSATVVENASAGTVVGVLSGVDPDVGQSANLSFSLVTPSDAFEIVNGNQLVVKAGAALDFEGQKSFAIDVRATDTGGLSKTQTFTVSLSDVNEAPSTVALSSATVVENASAGTVVGVLSGVDPDAGQSANLSFSLVTPSDAFEIVNGNQLVVKAGAALDFEGQKSFAIDVRATDTGGLSKTQTFTVSLSDVNEAPSTVALSSATVVENASAGTVVGVLSGVDPDAGQSANLSFSLVTPSDAFEIVNGNQLVVKAGAALDFEGQKSFAIDVRATDTGGLSKTQTFTVSLSDVNEAPSTVALSSATVVENASAGTVVGVLSGVDPDAGQSANLSFSLVTPSDAFEIVNGNQLVVKAGAALDFEGQKSFAIDVRATDTGGLSKTQTFTVSLGDVNEAPSTVALSSATVVENASAGTVVGVLSGVDPDAGQSANLSFSLVTPSDAFEIVNGNQLVVKAGAALDFEGQKSFAIDVRATDTGGLSKTQTFTVSLSDVNEAPTGGVAISGSAVNNSTNVATLTATQTIVDPDGITGGVDYQWRYSTDGGATWKAIAGATTANYSPTGLAVGALVQVTASYADAFGQYMVLSPERYIVGNGAANTLVGSAASDVILGLAGNDVIVGFSGADRVDGGTGSDTIRLTGSSADLNVAADQQIVNVEAITAASTTSAVTLDLSRQSEGFTVTGSGYADTITGSAGADTINAGSGNDLIVGFAGSDNVDGGAGYDTIILTQTSSDLNSGSGTQIANIEAVSAATANAGVTIDLSRQNEGFTVTGSNFADILTGSSGRDAIAGGNGVDVIRGGSGADMLSGGAGADTFHFALIGDTGTTAATRDQILDFQSTLQYGAEHDVIDLSMIDAIQGGSDQAFTFNSSAWGGVGNQFTAAGQLSYQYVTDTNGFASTIVSGNVKSNMAADFQIVLSGHVALTSSDFIL